MFQFLISFLLFTFASLKLSKIHWVNCLVSSLSSSSPFSPPTPPHHCVPALACHLRASWRQADCYNCMTLEKQGKAKQSKLEQAAELKCPLSFGHVDYKLQNSKEPGNPKVSTAGIHKVPSLFHSGRNIETADLQLKHFSTIIWTVR